MPLTGGPVAVKMRLRELVCWRVHGGSLEASLAACGRRFRFPYAALGPCANITGASDSTTPSVTRQPAKELAGCLLVRVVRCVLRAARCVLYVGRVQAQ
jgi:hypothetical protein